MERAAGRSWRPARVWRRLPLDLGGGGPRGERADCRSSRHRTRGSRGQRVARACGQRATIATGGAAMPTSPAIYGPDPIIVEGRHGLRYWLEHPFQFTGHPAVDERLSGFPVAVFQPHERDPAHTPVLIALPRLAP